MAKAKSKALKSKAGAIEDREGRIFRNLDKALNKGKELEAAGNTVTKKQ